MIKNVIKKRKPVIHLYIRGGCGNQFFQYAFARTIQEELGAELEINYICLTKRYPDDEFGFIDLLKDFNVVDYRFKNTIDLGFVLFEFIRFFRSVLRLKDFGKRTYKFYLFCAKYLPYLGIYHFDSAYYPFKYIRRKNIYIQGYFESAKYFSRIEGKLKEEFTSKYPLLDENAEFFKKIINSESVCVTIKRLDVESNNKRISDAYYYDISYFFRAIEYIKGKVKNPVFFIFSDDLEWCKKNFIIDGEVYYERENNPIWEKVRIMSSCKHFIIHNSTFSWWAQRLSSNENKVVVAPSVWTLRDDQPTDIFDDDWVYLNSSGELVDRHEERYQAKF